MIYVFEDGRILFREELLRPEDKGKYLAVEALPNVAVGENQQARFYADLKVKKVKHTIVDLPPQEEEGDELTYGDVPEEEAGV